MTCLSPDFDLKDSNFIRDEVESVLKEVGSVLHPLIPDNPRKSVTKSFRDNTSVLLPFLHHISTQFERVIDERRQLYSNPKLQHLSRPQRRKLLQPLFTEKRLLLPGKPFGLLPDWKLQPVFVDYATTQLETMFGKELGTLSNFQNNVFNLQKVKQLKKDDWYFMGFRTNGLWETHLN